MNDSAAPTTIFNREVFNLAADYADCPPEHKTLKEALHKKIAALTGQDSEDCMIFSLMIFCARGDRNKALARITDIIEDPGTPPAPHAGIPGTV